MFIFTLYDDKTLALEPELYLSLSKLFSSHDFKIIEAVDCYNNFHELEEDIKQSPFIVFTGMGDFAPSKYHSKLQYDYNKDQSKKIFDLYYPILDMKIPMILIGNAFDISLLSIGYSIVECQEHLSTTHTIRRKENIWNVNSNHRFGYNLYSDSQIEILEETFPTITKYSYEVEAYRLINQRILGIRWNPELSNCPLSGQDLAKKLIEEFLIKCSISV